MSAPLLRSPGALSARSLSYFGADGGADRCAGPRSCIGQTFAKAEFACILAAVVGRFEFELEPKDAEIEYQSGLVQRPKGGVTLRMKVVDRW